MVNHNIESGYVQNKKVFTQKQWSTIILRVGKCMEQENVYLEVMVNHNNESG